MKEFEESRIRLLLEERKWAWNRFPKVMRLYLCLLRAALPEDGPYGEIMLRRGDVLLSLKDISAESGLSISSIRTAINKLTATADLVFSTYGNSRIIHINDYDLYMTEAEEEGTLAMAEGGKAEAAAEKSGVRSFSEESGASSRAEKSGSQFRSEKSDALARAEKTGRRPLTLRQHGNRTEMTRHPQGNVSGITTPSQ